MGLTRNGHPKALAVTLLAGFETEDEFNLSLLCEPLG